MCKYSFSSFANFHRENLPKLQLWLLKKMTPYLLLARIQKDLVPGYPDVTGFLFCFVLFLFQLVHDNYYFAISQACNSRTHSRNKQTVMNFSINLTICFVFVGTENKTFLKNTGSQNESSEKTCHPTLPCFTTDTRAQVVYLALSKVKCLAKLVSV